MSERRTEIDIMTTILKILDHMNGHIKHTNLVHKTNLTHQTLTNYLVKMEAKGLLVRKASDHFFITEKGFEFVREYERMKSFLDSIDL